jgi:hypothetical protein
MLLKAPSLVNGLPHESSQLCPLRLLRHRQHPLKKSCNGREERKSRFFDKSVDRFGMRSKLSRISANIACSNIAFVIGFAFGFSFACSLDVAHTYPQASGRLQGYLNRPDSINLETIGLRNAQQYYRCIKEFYADIDQLHDSIVAFLEDSADEFGSDAELRTKVSYLREDIHTEIDDDRLDAVHPLAEKIAQSRPRPAASPLVFRS